MNKASTLAVTTPSDREIALTRVFDAPRSLVFETVTRPEYLVQWLGVRKGWRLAVCEVDLRAGGTFRYMWQKDDGTRMGMRGTFLEVVPPERVVNTEIFDEPWYPGQAEARLELTERGGRTTLVLTVRYESKDARDGVLRTPMKEGVEEGYDKVAEILARRR